MKDALGRDYYERGAAPGVRYRNGSRTGRVKSAKGAISVTHRSRPPRWTGLAQF